MSRTSISCVAHSPLPAAPCWTQARAHPSASQPQSKRQSISACAQEKLGGLIASFGLALLDRAILDALGRIEGQSIFSAVRANRIGLNATTAGDLAGFDLNKFLGAIEPAQSIHVRHTVGLLDALTEAELETNRLNDGLPESLEGAIAAYGHTYFKLKVAGDLDADIERLSRIAAVLDRSPAPISRRSTATSSSTTSKR